MLLPNDYAGPPKADALELIASRSSSIHRYHRVPQSLADTVIREGEAVLARNVMGDSSLGSRDSQGEIRTTSVMLRADPQRCGHPRPDPSLFDRSRSRARPGRPGVHAGGGRHRGGGPGEPQAPRRSWPRNLTQVRVENVELRERLGVQSQMVGKSPVVKKLAEEIARAASSNATVLIRGESGVGKELVARGIHYSSPRCDNVFIALNCAALSAELLASELFGHERGAFTGATERKIGKFEAAHRGTIMLDEIGEMSPGLQAKFLRVLEGHPFERVGGSKPINVDVRVIAATNRDLEKAVAEGSFRRDLYFRLRVLEIVVPALRKRAEDIPLLADYFLRKFNAETGRRIAGFTDQAKEKLITYLWPGNVRELKNVIERAVVLCRGQEIDEGDLLLTKLATAGDTAEAEAATDEFLPASLEDIERRYILATLNHTSWNKSRTANILGIERSTLDRKIRRYGLEEAR